MTELAQSLEDALALCQAQNLRLSRQRRYILELLWQSHEHLSAREIYDRLNQKDKPIGHTSVYQNLEALSAHGVIECIDRAEGRRYGSRNDMHSHINCLETDSIVDVDLELPAEVLQQVEAKTGMKITNYRIDFFGVPNGPRN
ncbi:Fur family transcriptional regulator [Synechococcus sp. PCC 7336]|uniref:Fur family transcriptional regulator n=1 Tax=Synechococcus sp. PCC 7336 TaxID=195250 RepID=UPI0003454EB1|nr:Fur family transcriptional regulator [Synechococcus sp. PCC 7336]